MAEAIKTKITAQGEKVRQLKSSGGSKDAINAEVAVLLQLKTDYKEVTGEDYGGPAKVEMKKPKKQTSEEEAKPKEPSKKSLKKAAKQAQKGTGARKSDPNGGMAPAALPAPATPISLNSTKRSLTEPPLLYCASEGPSVVKCLAASILYGIDVETSVTNPAEGMSFASESVLVAGGSTIFGANAICRYLSYKGTTAAAAATGGRGGGRAMAVEEWVEWEASTLSPAERTLATGKSPAESQRAAVAAMEALEHHLEGAGESKWIVPGDVGPSLADVVVGPTVRAVLALFGDGEVGGRGFHKARAYAEWVGEADAIASALEASEEYVKAIRVGRAGGGLHSSLLHLFDAAVFKAFPQANGAVTSNVVKCSNYKFGDFQCNAAMALFNMLKGTDGCPPNPMMVAHAVVAAVVPSPMVDSMSVAPSGFINIRLRSKFINDGISAIIRDGPSPPPGKIQKVAVDFSSPNIAKEMHVGHLRSTIIGDTICRVLEFCGHEVHRLNHVGDWGTQFGMLINYLKEAYPNFLTEPPNITDLTTFYKAAKTRFDADEEFKDVSRKTVVALQSGDPECREVWTLLCDISRKEFQKVYDRLGVKLTECGESFYNEMILDTIKELEAGGLAKLDDGATVVMLDNFTYPLIVRKRDGGFGYDSTDMAAIKYRLHTLKCDTLIYITDAGQAGHFEMCFDAANACGWVGKDKRLEHVGFGVVQGDDGKKFKTRSGETVRLVDLLDEAVRRMEASILKRIEEGKVTTTPEAAAAAASEMGYGAVKYFDLRQHPSTPYIFSYDRMLDTRGNTAVYLQFAHARLQSILLKAKEEKGIDIEDIKASMTSGMEVSLSHDSERALAFELLMFSDTIQALIAELCPSRLCDYLYMLATKFTDFVTNCRVLGSDEQRSRLLLCEATGLTMRKCFRLLGMEALDRI